MSIKCPKCRSNNPESASFCADCGIKLPSLNDIAATETLEAPKEELKEELTQGSTFAGRYEIIEELGKGGMGKVYRVEDKKIKEEVALKLIKPEIAADKKMIERFRNELKLARKITHKNVCRMYDFHEEEGTPYITMEYVPGENLKRFIQKIGKLPEKKATKITQQICRGLSEAHELGVVHRDLKPQNIMIDTKGNVKIMDFGISRSLEAKGFTQTGMIIGTPDYMSPEQAEGKEVDQRSDIYSLGVMLYEMITGKTPFDGDSALSIALKHKTETPPEPRELNDRISEELSAVILKCMEKEREERYQSAEELLSELINIEGGIPVSAVGSKPKIPAFLIEKEGLVEKERPVFVARKQELEKLNRFLEMALTGQGRVVFVTGEAGSGKTALVQEFAQLAQEEHIDIVVASGKCNAHTGIGDPYLPLIEILDLLTGDVEAKWTSGVITRDHASRLWNLIPLSIKALLDNGSDLIDIFVPGATLVSLGERFSAGMTDWLTRLKRLVEHKAVVPRDLTLQQSNLFEQYTRVIQALAHQKPLILVLDDMQWADAGSISLLFHLGRRIEGNRVLIVGTFRPAEIELGRGGERHSLYPVIQEFKRDFGDVELEVGKAESRQFVDAFIDTEPNQLDDSFRNTLYRQTKGNPLFTIELLLNMQEEGALIKNKEGLWVEGPELNWNALPARVDAVIKERISRLTEKLREILTIASVEGEEFTAEVVARLQEAEVKELIRLLSSELEKRHHLVYAKGIRQLDKQRLSMYLFQHILFQKYLYNTLDEVERTHLHEEVGNTLETIYGEEAEGISVQLARHFQEAGIVAKAIEYLHKAGNKAVRLSANEEAIEHFQKGLDLLSTLPDTPERVQQELTMLLALGTPLQAVRGFGAPEVGRTYERARELCQQVGETPLLINTLFSLSYFYSIRAEYKTALELAEQLVSRAEKTEDPLLIATGHWMLGWHLISVGEFARARAHLEQMITFYDPEKHRSLAFVYGQDPGASALTWTSIALGFLGYLDQALKQNKEALALSWELDHPFTLAWALGVSCCVSHILLRDPKVAKEHSEMLIRLSDEQGFAFTRAFGTIYKGWVQAEEGLVEEGIAQIRQGLAAYHATGTEFYRPRLLGLLAEAYMKVSKIEEGLKVLSESLALVEKTGEHFYEGEIFRLKGELLLMKDKAEDEAEACFRQAIDISRQQSTKLFELRAAVSLARLWQKQGKREEARGLLAEIYGWFTEGFGFPDLKEAKSLLEELS